MKKPLLTALALIPLGLVTPLKAQDLPYSSGSTGADGPLDIPRPMNPRYSHAAAFHAGDGHLVIFGGYSGGPTNSTQTLNPPHWSVINPLVVPPPRYEHAMVYDAVRQEVMLFGGQNNNGTLGDTWVWNGTVWAQKSPATSPSARYQHAMAYDSSRQETVLFGGTSGRDETWTWNGTVWTQKSPAVKPSSRNNHAMAYDSTRQRMVLFGGISGNYQRDTWEWNGTTWVERIFETRPAERYDHMMAYDAARQEVVLFGGRANGYLGDTWTYGAAGWTLRQPQVSPSPRTDASLTWDPVRQKIVLAGGTDGSNSPPSETWLWDGQNWTPESGSSFTIDMAAKPNGVWNHTSINVPETVTVNFRRNTLNTPVQWLASGAVTISGTLDLDGEDGRSPDNVEPGNEALAGPGGFDGGLGGRSFSVSGTYLGTAGGGPGGGAPGNQNQTGRDGTFSGSYGNTFLQPLIGGSGGGGGSSSNTANGGSGGAGGGAILIASSQDITVNGRVNARGGSRGNSSSGYVGGNGSGGAVRLVADRVLGTGSIDAGTGGRARIEGYYRPLAAKVSPAPSAGPPTDPLAGLGGATLTVSSVAGAGVRQPPQGSTANPDVIFKQAGPVTITVTGQNIPNGTPVTMRLATSTGVLNLPATGSPAVTMQNNTASFTATVPAGVGTIQAYASIPLVPGTP